MAVGDLQRVVGRNLRAYREARGLSQEVFAHRLGVHRTYMGGLERGERNLTLQSLERLAEDLGVDPVEFVADLTLYRDAAFKIAGLSVLTRSE